jgi:A/G-specific adenine glycosylase
MQKRIVRFRETVYAHYEKNGRTALPWRRDTEPWGVLVSEFMLQQTQIDRVIPYWERWLRLWPTPEALAAASLEEALREWNGLGYNRRGRFLWNCARGITAGFNGVVPGVPEKLITLPGIGAYTAGAITCFAYNYPSVFIETNIRAALIHFFFDPAGSAAEAASVSDKELFPILSDALDRENPRRWYWALMDYGAALKKSLPNPSRRSAHYTRQSRFEGSFRQRRGALLRSLLAEGPARAGALQERTNVQGEVFYQVIDALQKDLMVCCEDGVYKVNS